MTETLVQDLTMMTPVEIDTELARLWGEQQKWETYALSESRPGWRESDQQAAERHARVGEYKARAIEARQAAEPFEAEFKARGGWNRYFLVTNSNGHVHRGMDCNTCFDTTLYAWLVDLADCDEEAMVTEYGEKACTVCFPNAPAYKAFSGPGRRDAAAKAERDAEKAARAAVKAEKAINAEGSLKVPRWRGANGSISYDEVRTKIAARNALSERVQSYGFYGPSTSDGLVEPAIVILVEALDAVGFDTAKVIDTAAKKALKDGGTYDYRKAVG